MGIEFHPHSSRHYKIRNLEATLEEKELGEAVEEKALRDGSMDFPWEEADPQKRCQVHRDKTSSSKNNDF